MEMYIIYTASYILLSSITMSVPIYGHPFGKAMRQGFCELLHVTSVLS